MYRIPVLVIGAGQAGLAVSHELAVAGIEHVVVERGQVAERWASYQWQSLRLLTPNWLSRLPGFRYTGPDPDGFMGARDVAGFLRSYARVSRTPVVEDTEVLAVRRHDNGFQVGTSAGTWAARAVVVATGWCDRPSVPDLATAPDSGIAQLTAATYRRPQDLPDGRVLVVGASASGAQMADELTAAGREVVLAVGRHTRLPRRYRGQDIMWWLEAMGLFERRLTGHPEPVAALAEPSLQLAGNVDGRDVDLPALQQRGVRLVGRVVSADHRTVHLAADLADTTSAADSRLRRLLQHIDEYAVAAGLGRAIGDREPMRVAQPGVPVGRIYLRRSAVTSVIWATGYRRAYPWLRVPVLDQDGNICHVNGATAASGLYVMGMRWQSRRNSSFLDGVRHDAGIVAGLILDRLGARDPVKAAA